MALKEEEMTETLIPPEKPVGVKTYAELRKQVEKVLTQGRERAKRAVEEEKIRTYWETGRLIEAHILHHKKRAGYGDRVIRRLSRDFSMSRTLLYYILEFARAYPIVQPVGQLTWTDYLVLLSINDERARRVLSQEAEKFGWSRPTLQAKINELKNKGGAKRPLSRKPVPNRLIPKRGSLHTYRIVRSQTVHGEEELLVDLGFASFKPLGAVTKKKFREGEIVELEKTKERRRLRRLPEATRRDLFTYEGYVERVVDGDTLWVRIDLGLETQTRQKLRLRGLDAPEPGTEAGRRAKKFVEGELETVPHIILTTTKPDKFDRYLTDLYYQKEGGEEIFLNQLLLHKGLARLASSLNE